MYLGLGFKKDHQVSLKKLKKHKLISSGKIFHTTNFKIQKTSFYFVENTVFGVK
jgi:hypothetical protein